MCKMKLSYDKETGYLFTYHSLSTLSELIIKVFAIIKSQEGLISIRQF